MRMLKLVLVGVGQVGCLVAKSAVHKPGVQLVGAVDIKPELIGCDLGKVACGVPSGVKIEGSIRGLLNRVQADAVILTAVSSLKAAMEPLKEIISCGVPVVSTCEELAYPWQTAPQLAAELDIQARRRGVAVLGAGVNPGFLMDFLPLVMSSVCRSVSSIKISRVQNASSRRLQFQHKIGVGMTPVAFDAQLQSGGFGHIGLAESIYMLADAFGWQVEHIENEVAPVVSGNGIVAGIQQTARALVDGKPRITLFFKADTEESAPHDTIEIIGDPSFSSRIAGGINGDIASAAIVLNCAAALRRTSAGLHTMADFPIPYCS